MCTASYKDWLRIDGREATLQMKTSGLKVLKCDTVIGTETLHLSSLKCFDVATVVTGKVSVRTSGVNYYASLNENGTEIQLDYGFMLA